MNEDMSEIQERTQVRVPFQLLFIFLSVATIGFAMYWRTTNTYIREMPPTILPISPDKYSEFGGFANVITVGLNIDKFQSFSLVRNEFVFEGIVWFSYEPGTISLEKIQQFSFQRGTIVSKSPPDVKVKNGNIVVTFNVRVSFSTNLDYKDFPVDDHRLFLVLTNTYVSPGQIVFESSYQKFNVNADVQATGWDLADKNVEYGYTESIISSGTRDEAVTYSAVLFQMDYIRNSIRYTLSIILPLAMLLYIGLFSISLPLRTGVTLGAASASALLAYRFVIENLSPKSGFFMISDYIFFLFLLALTLVFVLNVVETKYRIPSGLKHAFVAGIQMGVAGIILYIFMA